MEQDCYNLSINTTCDERNNLSQVLTLLLGIDDTKKKVH